MTLLGYTMMCEQAGPKQLVRDVALAEEAGFDFAVISDHYFPWLDSQGHSPYAWSVLGAAAQATARIPLMTYVTCPIRRYHPAVVAQKAATMQLLTDGRFTLGLGAGENLNEHIVGGRWPVAGVRHEMLEEAVEIIRALWAGGMVTYRGKHFDVESAKVWDLPDTALRWFIGGWRVNAELPVPASFDAASRSARRRDPSFRSRRVHPRRVGPGRRGHPRAIHRVGGNTAAASPPGVLTGTRHAVVQGGDRRRGREGE
jgi:alkanesulfonate monooxygenase SsuD/methylene tetrahydromethanopterin reductase-like flavin-dependent oxidoreductase (luciferase family)